MKNISNLIKAGKLNTMSLVEKQKLRYLIEKEIFYWTHSNYATYADKDYLIYFIKNLENCNANLRLNLKNMNSTDDAEIGAHCNDRDSHSKGVGNNGAIVARGTMMNEDLTKAQGLAHDLGHMCQAHEGERDISDYLEEEGICFLHHSALSELMILMEEIHKKTIEDLENDAKRKGEEISEVRRKSWEKTYLDIVDGARCHCGESSTFDLETNRTKTNEDERKEFIDSFTVRGANKKTIARTPEGLIVLISDLIEYIPKDHKDGIIRGVITANNPEHEEILKELGISAKELSDWAEQGGKKEQIVYLVQRIFRNAVIDASFGKDGISLDPKMRDLMLRYRKLNYESVVIPSLTEQVSYMKEAKHKLIDKYAQALLAIEHSDNISEVKLTPNMRKMIHHIQKKQSPEIKELYSEIVRTGINNFLNEEIDEVIEIKTNGNINEKIKPTVRRMRIEEEIETAMNQGEDIKSKEYKEKLLKKLQGEINQTPIESRKIFVNRMIERYMAENNIPDVTHLTDTDQEKINILCKKNEKLRLKTFSECLCETKVAVYLGESTNERMYKLVLEEGIITQEQYENRNKRANSKSNTVVSRSLLETMREQEAEGTGGDNRG